MDNKYNEYINYFNFLKNLKNQPDTGLAPLVEWGLVIDYFVRTLLYLEDEWSINIDKVLDFSGCSFDEYGVIFRHRQNIAGIAVNEFKCRSNVANTASKIVDYLQENKLYSPCE